MCAALEHRGPDSRGLHHRGRAGIGIQRLRVIDLSTGDQPIFNEDRSVVVVMNGEIYNYRELRAELQARGHTFATQGDTEVIVHLYEEYGADCVRHLHGMFAFSLWDERRQQLLLARDRVGKKPLLYHLRDGVLSWASEMGALLQDTSIPREVDPVALDRYLAYGYVPAPRSALRGIAQAAAGAHAAASATAEITLERYWQLDYSQQARRARRGARRADPRRAAGSDPQAADRRRPARRVPLGRDRLVGGRGGDGAALAGAGADVLDRLRPLAVRRAAARAGDRASSSARSTRSSRSAPTRSRSCPGSSATTASRSRTPRRSRASICRS